MLFNSRTSHTNKITPSNILLCAFLAVLNIYTFAKKKIKESFGFHFKTDQQRKTNNNVLKQDQVILLKKKITLLLIVGLGKVLTYKAVFTGHICKVRSLHFE